MSYIRFGTDGIRGPSEILLQNTTGLRSLGSEIYKGLDGIIIGRDTRDGSQRLIDVISTQFGLVYDVGVLPTPALAWYLANDPAHLKQFGTKRIGGLMSTASHNPPEDVGIKVFDSNGTKSSYENLYEAFTRNQEFPSFKTEIKDISSYVRKVYLNSIHPGDIGDRIKGLGKIVVDLSNGSATEYVKEICDNLGLNIEYINDSSDGSKINLNCGTEHPSGLCEKIRETKASIGFAFDGDGDRLIVCDENGEIVNGDYILAYLATTKKDVGNKIVVTSYSNPALDRYLQTLDIETFRVENGDIEVLNKMRETNAVVGGEYSGHILLDSAYGSGDALRTMVYLLDKISTSQMKASELKRAFKLDPQLIFNINLKPDEIDHNGINGYVPVVEAAQKILGEDGSIHVRPSGTEPVLRVNITAQDNVLLNKARSVFES